MIGIGIILIFVAIFVASASTIVAAIIIFVAIIMIMYGIGNVLSEQPLSRDQEKLIEAQVKLLGQKVKAGESVDKLIDDMSGTTKMREKEERKEIIKGAVKGGIVAGDVGAVVGAMTAKNKIDNERK